MLMTMILLRTVSVLAAATALSGLTSAQFSPIGPFAGTTSEDFSGQTPQGDLFIPCVVDRVFSGQADLCAGGADSVYVLTTWPFSGCDMAPVSGLRFAGVAGPMARYLFDTGVTRFGGYFETNSFPPAGGLVDFLDANGNLLFSDLLDTQGPCTWVWNGWDFGGVAIKEVRVWSGGNASSSIMMDGMEADIAPDSYGTAFCVCDGSGSTSPCGNEGAAGNGCANSANAGGANLAGSGLASVSANTFVLHGSGLVPGQPGLYFQGHNAANNGNGALFGDGLRCAVGNVLRLRTVSADAGGNSTMSADIAAQQLGQLTPGDTRRYQVWYRDPSSSPCGSGFNLTNGLEVVWGP